MPKSPRPRRRSRRSWRRNPPAPGWPAATSTRPSGGTAQVDRGEHPRATTLADPAKLRPIARPGGSITAGNASGVDGGAAALIDASETAAQRHGLTPRARVVGAASAGVAPRIMGYGPVPAVRALCARSGVALDVIELNEACAAQALAALRGRGIADDDPRTTPNGGAIALGHPLGMSGARIAGSAGLDLARDGGRGALRLGDDMRGRRPGRRAADGTCLKEARRKRHG